MVIVFRKGRGSEQIKLKGKASHSANERTKASGKLKIPRLPWQSSC